MAEIDIDITTGGVLPLTVLPTSTDVAILQGSGRLAGWSLRDVIATVPKAVSGSVVAPAAAAVIATLTGLPAGTYTVAWTVGLQGAAAAGDADNFRLNTSAGDVMASVNPGAAGEYPQASTEITVPANGFIDVYAIAGGTAAVTYAADISITPAADVQTVVELTDSANILGEVSFTREATNTEHFGSGGIVAFGKITLHVVSGTVTGTVYVIPSRGSQ